MIPKNMTPKQMKRHLWAFVAVFFGSLIILIFEPHEFWSVLLGTTIGGSIIAISDLGLIIAQENVIRHQQRVIALSNDLLSGNKVTITPADRENAVYEELGP